METEETLQKAWRDIPTRDTRVDTASDSAMVAVYMMGIPLIIGAAIGIWVGWLLWG